MALDKFPSEMSAFRTYQAKLSIDVWDIDFFID